MQPLARLYITTTRSTSEQPDLRHLGSTHSQAKRSRKPVVVLDHITPGIYTSQVVIIGRYQRRLYVGPFTAQ